MTPLAPLLALLPDVEAERWRQLKKYGRATLPDGTGLVGDDSAAKFYKAICRSHHVHGGLTWRHILAEEMHEAFAETEYQALRAELLQVATVALAWVEDLDARAGDRSPLLSPLATQSGVHSHGIDPSCREGSVDGALRGECLSPEQADLGSSRELVPA